MEQIKSDCCHLPPRFSVRSMDVSSSSPRHSAGQHGQQADVASCAAACFFCGSHGEVFKHLDATDVHVAAYLSIARFFYFDSSRSVLVVLFSLQVASFYTPNMKRSGYTCTE